MPYFKLSVLSPTRASDVDCWAGLMVGAFDDAEIVHVEGYSTSGFIVNFRRR
jgi:hypothetical protein